MQSPHHDNRCHNSYHFFGDIWLPSPQEHLRHDELARLKELEPLIRDLEYRDQVVRYDLPAAFSDFATQETETWKDIGVERPANLLLHPSGDIGALVACHLHNPTFYVKNPYSQETDNGSNPTMHQINQAGFSSENCFIFHHICRRDRTEDVLLFYNEKINGVHEEFMLSLRRNMGAKIEICWGRHVRERMKKLVHLVPLRLWGQFQDVELHLELEGQKLKRFVMFVAHPQFFFYHGSFTEKGIRFRGTSAKRQDLLLAVAARLGSIAIVNNFYETLHRPALYGQFTKEHREVVSRLETDANFQLKTAFPEKYHEFELAAGAPEQPACDETITQVRLSKLITGDTEQEELRRSHLIRHLVSSFLEAAGQVLVGSTLLNLRQFQLLSEIPSDWDNILDWHEIPHPLVRWIQQQGGLQIDQKPISSKDELLTAFYISSPSNHSPCKETLMNIVLKVATWYISRVQKRRHENVRDLIIPGVRPYNIVRRRCSRCRKRVLDDIFATYAKQDPKKYVVWYRLHGCGRPTCHSNVDGVSFAFLIPVDPNQGYKMAEKRSLQRTRSASWEEYFLRLTEEERGPTQKEVQTRCEDCGEEFLDKKPRWTTQVPPSYVIPVRGCKACKTRFSSFFPADPTVATISKVSLSKKWADMKKGGLDPTDYPRRPDILWSRKTYLTKRKELERERDKVLAAEEDPECLSPSPKKRNFNSKRRLKSKA